MRRGHFITGAGAIEKLRAEMPIEVQMAFDQAIERSDFIRAADVVEHEWLAASTDVQAAREAQKEVNPATE